MNNIQDMTRFEYLPNEIVYLCLEYFNALEIFYSFDQLNTRFDRLIRQRRLSIRFEEINKTVFDQFCTKLSFDPEIKNQIYSIQLSNSYDYHQCKILFSHVPINEFFSLEKFQILPSFTHSSWQKCPIKQSDVIFSKLKLLSIERLNQFSLKTNQTSSIIHLILDQCTYDDYYNITKYLPLLKSFSIKVFQRYQEDNSEMKMKTSMAINLEQLIIEDFRNDFTSAEFLLKQTPNLTDLTLYSTYDKDFLDANRWKYFLTNFLSHLITFKFIFKCFFPENNQTKMIDIYQQFQNHFWHQQHHCYTQYTINNYHLTIYTIPYPSKIYQLNSNHLINFKNIQHLTINPFLLEDNSQCYFPNVRSLKIHGQDRNHSLIKIINLSKLNHLDISQTNILEQDPLLLVNIFQQTPHLFSLNLSDKSLFKCYQHPLLCTYFNRVIKKLFITTSDDYSKYSFLQNEQFYQTFKNVKHLNCTITNENDLFKLTKSLSKLITCDLLWNGTNDIKSEFSRFETYAREKKIDFHYKFDLENQNFDQNQYVDKSVFSYNIFLWLGNLSTNS